jgi:hypothetical protein
MVHTQMRVTGVGAGIILVSPAGKIHNMSYGLEFAFSNDVVELKYLLLGIENSLNFGCEPDT